MERLKKLLIFIIPLFFITIVSASICPEGIFPCDENVNFNNPVFPAVRPGSSHNISTNVTNTWNTNLGNLDNVNASQFENNGNTLSIIQSFLTDLISVRGLQEFLALDGSNANQNIDIDTHSFTAEGIFSTDDIGMLGNTLALGTLFEGGDITILFRGLTDIASFKWDESEDSFVFGVEGLDLTSEFSTEDVFDITANHLTSGRVFDIDAGALTTGQLFDVDMDSNALTTGKFFDFSHLAFPTANKTGTLGSIFSARFITGGTISDNYDVVKIGRFTERLGGTVSSAGSVLYLENTVSGAVTDTSHTLKIGHFGAGGNAIDIIGGDIGSDSDIKTSAIFNTTSDSYVGDDLFVTDDGIFGGDGIFIGNLTANQFYGEMWFHQHTSGIISVIVTAGVPVNVSGFTGADETGQDFNGFVYDSVNEWLTCKVAGKYSSSYQLSFGNTGNNVEYMILLAVNGLGNNKTTTHRKIGSAGDVGNTAGGGNLDLNINDNVSMQVIGVSNNNNILSHSGSVNLLRIGS